MKSQNPVRGRIKMFRADRWMPLYGKHKEAILSFVQSTFLSQDIENKERVTDYVMEQSAGMVPNGWATWLLESHRG